MDLKKELDDMPQPGIKTILPKGNVLMNSIKRVNEKDINGSFTGMALPGKATFEACVIKNKLLADETRAKMGTPVQAFAYDGYWKTCYDGPAQYKLGKNAVSNYSFLPGADSMVYGTFIQTGNVLTPTGNIPLASESKFNRGTITINGVEAPTTGLKTKEFSNMTCPTCQAKCAEKGNCTSFYCNNIKKTCKINLDVPKNTVKTTHENPISSGMINFTNNWEDVLIVPTKVPTNAAYTDKVIKKGIVPAVYSKDGKPINIKDDVVVSAPMPMMPLDSGYVINKEDAKGNKMPIVNKVNELIQHNFPMASWTEGFDVTSLDQSIDGKHTLITKTVPIIGNLAASSEKLRQDVSEYRTLNSSMAEAKYDRRYRGIDKPLLIDGVQDDYLDMQTKMNTVSILATIAATTCLVAAIVLGTPSVA